MKIIGLGPDTRALTGFNTKIILDYLDLKALAGATGSLQIYPASPHLIPAGTVVDRCGFGLPQAFDASDATINSLVVEVGDAVDPDRFLVSTQVAVDGTEVFYKLNPATTPHVYTAADAIKVAVTVAGGADPTLAELTQGKLEIYLGIWNLDSLKLPK